MNNYPLTNRTAPPPRRTMKAETAGCPSTDSRFFTQAMRLILLMAAALSLAACTTTGRPSSAAPAVTAPLRIVDLSDPSNPLIQPDAPQLDGAKNEWVSFCVQLTDLPIDADAPPLLRITSLTGPNNRQIALDQWVAYQVRSVPIDNTHAGHIRHTGSLMHQKTEPRVLVPLTMDRGLINLTPLYNTNPHAGSDKPAKTQFIWFDLLIPKDALAGDYTAGLTLNYGPSDQPAARLPISLKVYDFTLPQQQHLTIAGLLDWEHLRRLYPDQFEAVTPRLLNRSDKRYQSAITILDELVQLARIHRSSLILPQLQPTVKWPSNQPPIFDWHDFDSIVSPWLAGRNDSASASSAFWPLPQIDYLANYEFDRPSILDYWSAVGAHFDQLGWLSSSPALITRSAAGQILKPQIEHLLAQAAAILQAHPRIRVMVPLLEDQIRFARDNDDTTLPPARPDSRLNVLAPGLVFTAPSQPWPTNIARPPRWLAPQQSGLIPYNSPGSDERDIRLWAWLASLRQANVILWDSITPPARSLNEPADPSDVTWFYPGHWFGKAQPLATLQLKWLRRAEQDFEYLHLARERGQTVNAIMLARLLTKPVQIQPDQPLDPIYTLLSSTNDPHAWAEARQLLARAIASRQPGRPADPSQEHALNLDMLRWMQPQERPTIIVRSADFSPLSQSADANILKVRLGIDLYNASDSKPDHNTLSWTILPPGWLVKPQPIEIPALGTYHVENFSLDAHYQIDAPRSAAPQPLEITFTNGLTNDPSSTKFVLPVAMSDRREADLKLDGDLSDWTSSDAALNGPLVRMLNRPALQRRRLELTDQPAGIYTAWAQRDFYIAFKLHGAASNQLTSARNFVEYQSRRAWGEDLSEILIQAVYDDRTTGPLLHLVVKPGGIWVEQKGVDASSQDDWRPLDGAGIRYAGTITPEPTNPGDQGPADRSATSAAPQAKTDNIWRGEVAIPWETLLEKGKPRPKYLRFNFVQHSNATGLSASWAGPIDFGRDANLMGLLILREPDKLGM